MSNRDTDIPKQSKAAWLKRHGFTNGLWRLKERAETARKRAETARKLRFDLTEEQKIEADE